MLSSSRRSLWCQGLTRKAALVLVMFAAAPAQGTVRYVKANASGANNGTSWTDAYTSLQSALTVAGSGDQIWVAAATYKPSAMTNPPDPRSASFTLINGVTMYGGFAGTETLLTQRNPAVNVTTLSGDLNGNDVGGLTDASRNENCYHVVTSTANAASTILDGFRITSGQATGVASADKLGAGMVITGGAPTIHNCIFITGYSTNYGGGCAGQAGASATITNCRFLGNGAGSVGGAVYNNASQLKFVNCEFSGNSGGTGGGGIRVTSSNPGPTITNCTFSANSASLNGGGLYITGTSIATVTNCVFWGNTGGTGQDSQVYLVSGGSLLVNYSSIQNWSGSLGGTGNNGSDPLLLDANGTDNIVGTLDDDLRLGLSSPGIDAGNNGADTDANSGGVQALPNTDLVGLPRFVDIPTRPDTGAGTPPLVDRGAHEAATVVYVNAAAPAGGNGTSWVTAYNSLKDALLLSTAGSHLWIAGGTYRPPFQAGDTFTLSNSKALFGGFTGAESNFLQRNPIANLTVLSGDSSANDSPRASWPNPPPSSWADNCYHVVTVPSGSTGTCVLDGVTITAGYAKGTGILDFRGGGIYVADDAIIRNCVISNNVTTTGSSGAGGGLYVAAGVAVQVQGCMFNSNSAYGHGGAVGSLADFVDCDFVQNTATLSVGALSITGDNQVTRCRFIQNKARPPVALGIAGDSGAVRTASGIFTDCVFVENGADFGGAVGIFGGSPMFFGCSFVGNLTNGYAGNTDFGGAVYLNTSSPTSAYFQDCLFDSNGARNGGGAVALTRATDNATFANCRFENNTTNKKGGAILQNEGTLTLNGVTCVLNTGGVGNEGSGGLHLAAGTASLTNCSLQSNTSGFSSSGDGLDVEAAFGALTLDDVELNSNGICLIRDPLLALSGFLWLVGETVNVRSGGTVSGPGYIELDSASVLNFGTESSFYAGVVTLAGNLSGTGTVHLDRYHELILQSGASIDLSGQVPSPGPCADPNQSQYWGQLTLDGLLRLQGGMVQNCRITVNNDATVSGCGNETGGRIVFDDAASVLQCNDITSYGDRYAIFAPPPALPPVIGGNKVTGVVTRDVSHPEEGDLFELRQQDTACPTCPTGLNHLPASDPAYLSTWAMDELRVLQDAKINFTDRPRFQFGGSNEALFVRTIRLFPGAVINTAFNRVYYDSLVDENGLTIDPQNPPIDRTIRDIPLLGFSLGVITFENACEFDVRIGKRTQGPPPSGSGTISRITSNGAGRPIPAGAGGIMDMRSLTADSIAAKGFFNKQGENKITVKFEYMFPESSDPGELWVHVSGDPAMGQQLNHIAIINPPSSPTDPGGYQSNQMALFHGIFDQNFDLSKGAYVELELRNPNSRVWIDDFDPVVCSWCACGDMDGDVGCGLADVDYLYLLSEYGNAVNDFNNCADQMGHDNYVDLSDLNAWSSQFHNQAAMNLCDGSLGPPGGTISSVTLPSGVPVIAGKPGLGTISQNDALYPMDPGNRSIGSGIPAPAQNSGIRSGHGSPLVASDGQVYQLHGSLGLIELGTSQAVLSPGIYCNFPSSGVITRVGPTAVQSSPCMVAGGGFAINDAAFHPSDPNTLYIAPVQVIPPGGTGTNCPYPSALKMHRTNSSSPFVPETLYGSNPSLGSAITIPPGANCAELVYSPDRSRVREIEVDSDGNVFVLAAQAVMENDYILLYPNSGGMITVPLAGMLDAPTAMHVSGDKLYVSTAFDGTDGTADTRIWRFSIQRAGINVTNLLLDQAIPIPGIRFITTIKTEPAGALWAVGFSSTSCSAADCQANPNCSAGCTYNAGSSIFTTPKLAIVSNPTTTPSVTVSTLSGSDLALPIGLAFTSTQCGTGDFDGGGANLSDVPLFVIALLTPSSPALCSGDMNFDGDLNGSDIPLFISRLMGS